MRVLFSSHRDRPHLFPMVPLAWACRAAGHEVRIASAPRMVDSIVHTGLPAVRVGRDDPPPASTADIAKVFQNREYPADWPAHPHLLDDEQRAAIEVLGTNCARAAEHTVDDLVAFARDWRPDLIVHDTAAFAGVVAAAAIGVPNVRHLTGPGLQPMETHVGTLEPLPEYAALFERRGLDVRVLPALTIRPAPPSLHQPVADPCHLVRYVPYNGSGTVPPELTGPGERQRILLTWGLSVSRVAARLGPQGLAPFRLAIDALSTLDIEVVLVASAEQLTMLGVLPDNVRPVTGVPLHLAISSCTASIHHASDGSAMASAVYGVPQLTITRSPVTALTGNRLVALGAGAHLRYQDLEDDPDAIAVVADTMAKLLADPAYIVGAARLRAEIDRQPTPADLVPTLQTLAAGDVEPDRKQW